MFLDPNSIVVSGALACFRAIAAADIEHHPLATGGGAARVEPEDLRWINTIVGNVTNALHGTLSQGHCPASAALSGRAAATA